MRNILTLLVAVIILCISNGCRRQSAHPINFYYWKSNISFGETERTYFNQLGCKRLYIRLFDIDSENNQPVPVGKIERFDAREFQAEYVPVIFITNRTFASITDQQIETLAENTYRLIAEIATANRLPAIEEISIDCDWTQSTRAAYFRFLQSLHNHSRKPITCTLRLHQIKDFEQTGIPPVERGYLMCYATSNPTGDASANSILDIPLLKSYTKNIDRYPLAFDVALPLYSWGIVTNHLGQRKLINGLTEDDLLLPSFSRIGEGQFIAEDDLFLNGLYINKGFTIKLETITPTLLEEAKQYLDSQIDNDYRIVYFHLSEGFLKRFTYKQLQ